ncbi:MAG: TRAP transporter small permease [Anaerotignaceae bacterium]
MFFSRMLNKASDGINKFCMTACVLLLGTMVAITFAQIIFRVFFTALSWSEELARYMLVWSTMIGAGCVYKSGGHISVLIVQNILPDGIKKYAKVLVHILCGIVFVIACIYGLRYMELMGAQKSPALGIPMKYMYMSVPVGCAIMLFHAAVLIIDTFCKKKVGEEK